MSYVFYHNLDMMKNRVKNNQRDLFEKGGGASGYDWGRSLDILSGKDKVPDDTYNAVC